MLVAAALVPETALIVPGAAGRADVLAAERAAVLLAVAGLFAAGPDRVHVVGPVRRPLGAPLTVGVSHGTGPASPGVWLGAAGVDEGSLGWSASTPSAGASDRGGSGWPAGSDHRRSGPATVATTVGRLVLAAGGWTGRVDVDDVDDVEGTTAGDGGRTALLLVGSLSARRGPDGPLPDDPRVEGVEADVVADLVDLGPAARRRLADLPAALADELAISARPLWRHLVAEVDRDGRRWRGELHSLSAPFGATYAVLTWAPEQQP